MRKLITMKLTPAMRIEIWLQELLNSDSFVSQVAGRGIREKLYSYMDEDEFGHRDYDYVQALYRWYTQENKTYIKPPEGMPKKLGKLICKLVLRDPLKRVGDIANIDEASRYCSSLAGYIDKDIEQEFILSDEEPDILHCSIGAKGLPLGGSCYHPEEQYSESPQYMYYTGHVLVLFSETKEFIHAYDCYARSSRAFIWLPEGKSIYDCNIAEADDDHPSPYFTFPDGTLRGRIYPVTNAVTTSMIDVVTGGVFKYDASLVIHTNAEDWYVDDWEKYCYIQANTPKCHYAWYDEDWYEEEEEYYDEYYSEDEEDEEEPVELDLT